MKQRIKPANGRNETQVPKPGCDWAAALFGALISMRHTPPDIKPEELFSQYSPDGMAGRLFNFPLMRVIVIGLFLAPVMIFNAAVVMQVIEKLEEPVATYVDMARLLITIPVFILSYRLYCQTFEKR